MSKEIFAIDRSTSVFRKFRITRGGEGRFDAEILEEKVREIVAARCNGNREEKLYDPETTQAAPGFKPCHVAVVAVYADHLNTEQPRVLSSYDRNQICTIWQAARATSAAPTFFDPIEFGVPPVRYIDAGFGFNNPAEIAYDEVKDRWSGRQLGLLLSLGTGKESIAALSRSPSKFGVKRQLAIVEALEQMATSAIRIDGQMWKRFHHMHSGGKAHYYRFNVDSGMDKIGLQEWEKQTELAGLTTAYLGQSKTKHEKNQCALHIRRLSRRSKPFERSAAAFRTNGEQHMDTDFPAMRYWYREEVDENGYPVGVFVGPEFRKTIRPVGREILSLRRVAMLLVRSEAFDITPGKYTVKWLLWFWAGSAKVPPNQETPRSFPTATRNVSRENSLYERSFSPTSPDLSAPEQDSGFFHCGNLKLTVGRAKAPSESLSIDFDPNQHQDYPEYLLQPGYGQHIIDWGAWNTLRNTGWSQEGGTIVEVHDDGYLAFMISMDWPRPPENPRWLGGVAFGGVRLEPVAE